MRIVWGYISHKPNIKAVYPFQEDGLKLADIKEILLGSGVGLPPYTRSGGGHDQGVSSASTNRRSSGYG